MKDIVKNAIKHYDEIIKYQYEIVNKRWLDRNSYINILQ